ncbi:unnamed protein product [Protopolystoma xenopodis]|uniref:Uncharacterized protein n=1 Tax=Protopolystoma xenopodis TaxID=117903 RepID=A0A3S5AL89_9PLAT|nr:unnamed protein product [Protopolystoma xenopodis]
MPDIIILYVFSYSSSTDPLTVRVAGTQTVSKYCERSYDEVRIHLVLYRYPGYATDVLVYVNDPLHSFQ